MRILPIAFVLFAFVICSCGTDDSASGGTSNVIITPKVGVGTISFADDGNRIVQEHGMYGHLTASVSLNDAAFVMWYDNGLGFQLEYKDVGDISLQEVVDMSSELIDLDQKIIQMVVMSPFKGETREGIKLGSTRADVIAAYGEPDDIDSITEDYDDLKINFWYNSSDNVRRMDLLP